MSRKVPALSVALSVYNGAAYLDEAIASIRAQTFADFEFLILDDGSTDASRAIAETHAAQDPRIRVIARENRGLIASLNQLLLEARAPLVARMDADDIARPQRFARQLAFLATNPDHGVVGCDCTMIGPDGLPLDRPPVIRPLSHEAILANLESGPLLLHNGVIYARNLVLEAGGYRPAFAHAEDYDLWLRLSTRTRMANLPDRLLCYRLYPEQVSSRHLVEQARNAAIAWLEHRARAAAGGDGSLLGNDLPDDGDLDTRFGLGSTAYVARRIVARALHAPRALAGEGWPMLLTHANENGRDPALWRLAGRMLAAGRPLRAGRLGMALLQA